MSSNASTPGIASSARSAARKSDSSVEGLSEKTTWWRIRSGKVVDLLEAVDGRVDALHARLELQRQVERVVARLVQVAAVEPQRLLPRRFPHVALLALPRAGVLLGVRTEAPYLPDLVRDLLGDEVGGVAVHGAVARGVDDEVGGQLGAVLHHHRVLGEVVDLAVDELDRAVGDELGRADVDVVARSAAQVLHEQPRVVLAPVELEAGGLEAVVEVLVALAHLVVERDLEFGKVPEGGGREDMSPL